MPLYDSLFIINSHLFALSPALSKTTSPLSLSDGSSYPDAVRTYETLDSSAAVNSAVSVSSNPTRRLDSIPSCRRRSRKVPSLILVRHKVFEWGEFIGSSVKGPQSN